MVDLPAPFSPTIACTSPAAQSRSTSSSTRTPRNSLPIPLIWISGAAPRWASFSTLSSATLTVRPSQDQRPQVPVGDLEPLLDLLGAATPDGILVFDREHAVEAALVQAVDVVSEIDLAEARDPVTPPAHVPGLGLTGRGAAEEPEPVALGSEGLGVLGVRVDDPVDVGPQRLDRVDAEPQQVRGVEVEMEPEPEHPLPELR